MLAISPKYKILPYCSAEILFKFVNLKYNAACFLDSSSIHKDYGRYSFIAFNPVMFFEANAKDVIIYDNNKKIIDKKNGNPFDILNTYLSKFKIKKIDGLPPFQGGACGYFGYEMLEHIEDIDVPYNHMKTPDMAIGFYNIVIAFDNILQKSWLIYSDIKDSDIRDDIISDIQKEIEVIKKNKINNKNNYIKNNYIKNNYSNFDELSYKNAVKSGVNKILEGDIFEVNLSQQFSFDIDAGIDMLIDNANKYDLYLKLRDINQAPFSAYLNFSHLDNAVHILSNSPERFLKLVDNNIETKPIKGTIKRCLENKIIDRQNAELLLKSEKDRAENIMIVDLMRNDLAKVCELYSVRVPKLCALESYAGVHHLVSTVIGVLKKCHNAIDLLKVTFPGGSITGAPKVEAMKVISEIEGVRRGPYCGSIGYIGFDGDMDVSISIRTMIINKDNTGFLQAGGAVTAKSDPLSEYQESLVKVDKFFQVLFKKNKNKNKKQITN
jgi:para-aminobenzoate synthetase component I